MGFEDEIPDTEDAVKAANAYAENKRNEAAAKQAETIAKMQQNQEDLRKKQEQLAQLSEVLGINEMPQDRPAGPVNNLFGWTDGRDDKDSQ